MTEDVIAPPSDAQVPPEATTDEAAALDLIESETADTQESQEEAPRFTVKINGKEREATLDELVTGYQKATAADQRFEEAANNRKQAEAIFQQAQAVRDTYQQRLEQFIPESAAKLQNMQIELQGLAESDPAAWVAKKQQFDAELMRYTQAQTEHQRMGIERQQAEQQRVYQMTEGAAKFLSEKIPGWEPGNDLDNKLRDYAEKIGMPQTSHVIRQSPHIAVALHKSMLYDDLMQKVASRKLQPSETSTAPNPPSVIKHRSSGSKDPDKMTGDEWIRWREKQVRA